VPVGEPPLDAMQLRLLAVADLFMALMWSRPGGLSLRTAWVTPATIVLALVVTVLVIPAAALFAVLAIRGGNGLLGMAGLICILLGLGAGSVVLYGIRQRLIQPQ
jgi:hypothetical protein